MAQYYEVVSQGKANSDQTHQFFDSGDNEGAQVRYILAEDATQFSTQQVRSFLSPILNNFLMSKLETLPILLVWFVLTM